MYMQGKVKFNAFGTRIEVTLNLFQYRLSTSVLQRDLIGQIKSVDETEIELRYLAGENDDSVFLGQYVLVYCVHHFYVYNYIIIAPVNGPACTHIMYYIIMFV